MLKNMLAHLSSLASELMPDAKRSEQTGMSTYTRGDGQFVLVSEMFGQVALVASVSEGTVARLGVTARSDRMVLALGKEVPVRVGFFRYFDWPGKAMITYYVRACGSSEAGDVLRWVVRAMAV